MGQLAKSARKRISLLEFTRIFDSEEKAMRFFESVRWRKGRCCPHCGSTETKEATHKTMPYWCPSCRKYFSVRTKTLMEESRLPYLTWLTAIYLIRTSLKGISSTKLGNDLGISQQSAWFLGHRIREGWKANAPEMLMEIGGS
ncbi:MAG: IS1595 family transposase [Candidatus Dadabacteria bacterium]|nr:IS1595 family transposase [Candidatus Dadabacteria bacterium]